MLKLVSFLNNFDKTIRQKLSKFDEKLDKLERSVGYIETMKRSGKSRIHDDFGGSDDDSGDA